MSSYTLLYLVEHTQAATVNQSSVVNRFTIHPFDNILKPKNTVAITAKTSVTTNTVVCLSGGDESAVPDMAKVKKTVAKYQDEVC